MGGIFHPIMKLSINIVSWNTKELLDKCLESIFQNLPGFEFEVLVVDNASNDGSGEMVTQRYPQVRLTVNPANIGFADANNQAIRENTGEYSMLLNPDTEVYPGALDTLIRFMDLRPEAGAAGPLLLNPDQSLQTSCYPEPTLPREFWRLFHLDRISAYGIYDMTEWNPAEIHPVEVIQGACLVIRKIALDQVGLLDSDYFMYTEEVDLCHRLAKANWALYWVPQAAVIHYGGQSTKQIAADMFLQLYRSKIQYFRKNHGRLAGITYKLILLASALGRVVITPLAFLEAPARREMHKNLSHNYQQLLIRLPSM